MAVVSEYYEDALLDCLRNQSDAVVAAVYMQLHTGDPGSTCTSNVAQHTARVQVTFGSAAASGLISDTAAVTFSSLTTDETISYISTWDHTSTGNALYYGALTTAKSVNTGDTLEFAIGDVDISIDQA